MPSLLNKQNAFKYSRRLKSKNFMLSPTLVTPTEKTTFHSTRKLRNVSANLSPHTNKNEALS